MRPASLPSRGAVLLRPLRVSASPRLRGLLIAALTFTLTFPFTSRAYPPAPNYTLHGLVRDQVGKTLSVEGAEIILLRDGLEIGRASIFANVALDWNYELSIRIDQTVSGTRTYSTKAVAPQGIYSLRVALNGQTFLPIEASGVLRAGNGGERVRLDLTLGADANNDGLPDAWQEYQLYQSGRRPGDPGWNISLITRDGDFDGDGTSNWLEYVAGTFAADATERLDLKLTAKSATHVAFEFYAITGKVYGIEQSSDLRSWSAAPFSLTLGGATASLHKSAAAGPQPAFVAVAPGESRFYRLTVR